MITISNYFVAISFTVLAMIFWGSWPNTQKMVQKNWKFELYYWDKITGILIMALISAFTVGSLGSEGQSFLQDFKSADSFSILYALAGGALWNAGNLFMVAAIATAGMSVAFPIGGGIAWILGIIINYIVVARAGESPTNNPAMLWIGVVLIIVAIFLSSKAYNRLAKEQKKPSIRGIVLSFFAGLFIAFFYGFVVKSLDGNLVAGGSGSLTPYTAVVYMTFGIILCTILFYLFIMKPLHIGIPGTFREYFNGSAKTHMAGILGGMIWCGGTVFSFMAVGAASPAISYGLSNAAPVVAILWGIFVWKEFKGSPKGTNAFLISMFILYITGLLLITVSNA